MKNCTKCGTQLDDNALFCPNCGVSCSPAAAQQDSSAQMRPEPVQSWQQPVSEPTDRDAAPMQDAQPTGFQSASEAPVVAKKRSTRPLWVGLGCLLLLAVVGAGLWVLLRLAKPEAKLLRAASNSVSSFKDYVADLPNLHTIVDNLEKLDENACSFGMEIFNESSYNFDGQTQTFRSGMHLNVSADKRARQAMLSGAYVGDSVEIPFTVYLDEQELRVASPVLLEEDEALMLPMQDLAAQWNASKLSELSELTLPEDLKLDLFGEQMELDQIMTEAYGEDWKRLRDSFEVVEYEGTSPFGTEGVTYSLRWDRDLLKTLYEKSGADMEDLLDDMEDQLFRNMEDLFKTENFNKLTAQLVLSEFGMMNETVRNPLVYVENDLLTGLQLNLEKEYEHPILVTVRLLGAENPWEHVTATVCEEYSSYTTTDTADVRITRRDGELLLTTTVQHEDSDGEAYSEFFGPFVITYTDASGEVTCSLEQDNDGTVISNIPAMWLTPVDGGLRFRAVQEIDYGVEDMNASTDITMTLTSQVPAMEAPGAKVVELLKLSEEELQTLFERIAANLGGMSGMSDMIE